MEDRWSTDFAQVILNAITAERHITVTWLNHYSAAVDHGAGVPLSQFDYVGVDGSLLKAALGGQSVPRTSADLVLPKVLAAGRSLRLGIVGGTFESVTRAARVIEAMQTGGSVVFALPGFGEIEFPEKLQDIDLLILGMGAPKQDLEALAVSSSLVRPTVIATCGGWLDQVQQRRYYPPWAYPLHLNWAVRLAKEPKRLAKRYTLDAWHFLRSGAPIVAEIRESRGFRQYCHVLDGREDENG